MSFFNIKNIRRTFHIGVGELIMKKIIFIPPKYLEYKKLRVAAYCRVSTLNKIQRNSLQWQIGYYTNMIQDNSDWIFAGVW
jgi:site-specific DNA recombinase